jgi:hypothetical protein
MHGTHQQVIDRAPRLARQQFASAEGPVVGEHGLALDHRNRNAETNAAIIRPRMTKPRLTGVLRSHWLVRISLPSPKGLSGVFRLRHPPRTGESIRVARIVAGTLRVPVPHTECAGYF